jgi:hypothetical protein
MSVTHKLNTSAVHALLTSPQGGVVKDLIRRGLLVESRAKRNLGSGPKRVNTGRLRSSITTTLVMTNGKPGVRVGTSLKYAIYVHEGTGLYGPKHKMIVPVNKKVLRWKTKGKKGGKGGYTFSMKSSGMRPNPFLKNALKAAKG